MGRDNSFDLLLLPNPFTISFDLNHSQLAIVLQLRLIAHLPRRECKYGPTLGGGLFVQSQVKYPFSFVTLKPRLPEGIGTRSHDLRLIEVLIPVFSNLRRTHTTGSGRSLPDDEDVLR